ncbi:MAG: hypothetical protein WCW35_11935 [Bacteroidota bacterium]
MLKTLLPLFVSFVIASVIPCEGCADNSSEEALLVLNSFYKNTDNFRTIDSTLLSHELRALIDTVQRDENFEAEKIVRSKFPTDKPLMIEGNIFTSLYEGHDAWRIDTLRFDGKRLVATVICSHSSFNKVPEWTDKVVLVNENGWKVDNVLLQHSRGPFASSKEILFHFIHSRNN